MNPRAYVGADGGGVIYLLDEGSDDAGVPIRVRAQSNPLAPGGSGADHAFDRLYVTVTHTMAASVVVTPIVDGALLGYCAFAIVLDGPWPERQSQVFEHVLRLPLIRGGIEVSRYAPRGTWLSVRIDVDIQSPGELILDSCEVDHDVLTPTKVQAGPTGLAYGAPVEVG